MKPIFAPKKYYMENLSIGKDQLLNKRIVSEDVPVFSTDLGSIYNGLTEKILAGSVGETIKGKVNLIFTSPPFPLNRKKKYGNETGQEYVNWLANYADIFRDMLAPDGSIIIEVGNSWEKGIPAMSTLALEALLEFKKRGDFYLCQQCIWHNPARLPSPIQWVNVERSRLKDSFTHIWWLSPTPKPKADNRNVLVPYSDAMKSLLKSKKYNPGIRPSEYNIGATSFLKENQGAIPSSLLTAGNTESASSYLKYCKENSMTPHPARMPSILPNFFIKFLTDEGDLVLDPFAGSNTTGSEAELLKRKWISIEANMDYINSSLGRFNR